VLVPKNIAHISLIFSLKICLSFIYSFSLHRAEENERIIYASFIEREKRMIKRICKKEY